RAGEAGRAVADSRARPRAARAETRSRATAAPKVPKPPKPVGVLPHIATGVDRAELEQIFRQLTNYPDGFTPHPKLAKQFENRQKQFDTDHEVDWATAEAMAIGSLIGEGYAVRLAGEDSRRGTVRPRDAAPLVCTT